MQSPAGLPAKRVVVAARRGDPPKLQELASPEDAPDQTAISVCPNARPARRRVAEGHPRVALRWRASAARACVASAGVQHAGRVRA